MQANLHIYQVILSYPLNLSTNRNKTNQLPKDKKMQSQRTALQTNKEGLQTLATNVQRQDKSN